MKTKLFFVVVAVVDYFSGYGLCHGKKWGEIKHLWCSHGSSVKHVI